jgi:sporulation protein YlmC with PRC-barrel domain
MAETVQFTIGADAVCTDGTCGQVIRVVVDPVADEVTHLVVEPEHRRGEGRLVPLDLVDATRGEVRLRCTKAEFERLDPGEETQFVPGTGGYPAYGPDHVLSWPYYGLGGDEAIDESALETVPQTLTFDTVPLGEVAIRRGSHVEATDGTIGRVEGLVINRANRHVTHVLLQEGHLWGRKDVAIPISAVTDVKDGIWLNITKQQVEDLPAVDIRHPGR